MTANLGTSQTLVWVFQDVSMVKVVLKSSIFRPEV